MNLLHFWVWHGSGWPAQGKGGSSGPGWEPLASFREFRCVICSRQFLEDTTEEWGRTLPREECSALRKIVERPEGTVTSFDGKWI